MILIDANVFMYAAGREHPLKAPAVAYLERIGAGAIDAAIDAETLQEILHRYRALKRWAEGRTVYDTARLLIPDVIAIDAQHMDRARRLLDQYSNLSARDAIHAAVVLTQNLQAICSFDGDFDAILGLRRIVPK